MTGRDRDHDAPIVRNVVLLVAFLFLVVVGLVTVVLPELEGDRAGERDGGVPDAGVPGEPALPH